MVAHFDRKLGREISARRKLAGLSQERLSFACGLHRTYIGSIERGIKSPTVRTLRAIAAALDTSAAELLQAVEVAR